MATKYDQSSATRPVSIRSHTSAFQVHFKHTSSALEMSSVNPPIDSSIVWNKALRKPVLGIKPVTPVSKLSP